MEEDWVWGWGGGGHTGGDVSENSEFGGKLHVGPEETTEERCEGSFPEPLVHWVEDELVASISISAGID